MLSQSLSVRVLLLSQSSSNSPFAQRSKRESLVLIYSARSSPKMRLTVTGVIKEVAQWETSRDPKTTHLLIAAYCLVFTWYLHLRFLLVCISNHRGAFVLLSLIQARALGSARIRVLIAIRDSNSVQLAFVRSYMFVSMRWNCRNALGYCDVSFAYLFTVAYEGALKNEILPYLWDGYKHCSVRWVQSSGTYRVKGRGTRQWQPTYLLNCFSGNFVLGILKKLNKIGENCAVRKRRISCSPLPISSVRGSG